MSVKEIDEAKDTSKQIHIGIEYILKVVFEKMEINKQWLSRAILVYCLLHSFIHPFINRDNIAL